MKCRTRPDGSHGANAVPRFRPGIAHRRRCTAPMRIISKYYRSFTCRSVEVCASL
ncbi:uncharacterized protein BCN122_II0118 [Burkholderia cenocepacia]|nr:uncharacterized protein BCN122_II0118 [Burkholderia cenocepacia]WJN72691.1 hypothetical protein OH687_20520 [Burkholderia anthina]